MLLWPIHAVEAQVEKLRPHALLIPTWGSNPLATIIEAQAKLLEAQGDFLESAGTARKFSAEAFALEIHDSVEERKAHFERRRIDRAGIEEEIAMLREANERMMKRLVENNFPGVLDKPDVSAELNWLLIKLCGPTMAVQHLSDSTTIQDLGDVLTEEMIQQVRLSDGGPGGSRLEFRLSDGKFLQTDWPPGLCRKQFEVLRTQFELARDELLKEVEATGQVRDDTRQRIDTALDGLSAALDEVFPWYYRHLPSVKYQYHGARDYLQSLAIQARRAMSSKDRTAFCGRLRFQGKTVLDLIRHMYETGTVFAPPEPGAERVYRSLAMRFYNIYMELAPKKAPANNQPTKG